MKKSVINMADIIKKLPIGIDSVDPEYVRTGAEDER